MNTAPTPVDSSPPPGRRGRNTGRLAAVQALYQIEATQESPDRVIKDFLLGRVGGIALEEDGATAQEFTVQLDAIDSDLFVELVRTVQNRGGEIDGMIKNAVMAEWPWERIEMTLRSVLRAGVAELLARADIPAGVTVASFVDVGHAFYDGPEPRMINAVLDRIARALGRLEGTRAPRKARNE